MSSLRNLTFEQMLVFIAVVETGSLTRAAQRLGVGKTMVSKTIQRLEFEVGASLIVRTTRSISLTEAGTSFFNACRDIVALAEEAVAVVSPAPDELRGTLKVASSVEYSAIVLAPVVARMRAIHPGLRIEMVSGDNLIDTVTEGVDVAIRLGRLADSGHRAVRIGEYAKWLVASPDFLAAHALPPHVADAANLPFVGLSVLAHPSRCHLRNAQQDSREVDFVAHLLADTVYACRAAATQGAGIALLPDFAVRADIAAQRLVRVYADWSSEVLPIHALLAPSKHISPKTRTFVDMLRAHVDEAR
jgi:DNA-binding transcriptional LysR family regulator